MNADPTHVLDLAERLEKFASSPLAFTAFLLTLVALCAYVAYALVRQYAKRHAALLESLAERHKLCEWRVMNVVQAMMFHVKANAAGKRGSHGQRATEELVGKMLEAALKGPTTDAEHAAVRAMPI